MDDELTAQKRTHHYPKGLLERLQTLQARDYPQHRLSYNGWIMAHLKRLADALEQKGESIDQ